MAAKKKTSTTKRPSAPKKPARKLAPKKPAPKKSAKRAAPKRAPAKTAGKKPSAKKMAVKRSSAAKRRPLKSKRPSIKPKRPALKQARTKQGPRTTPVNAEAHQLALRIASVAADKKATDVAIIDTYRRASLVGYDYVVIASGDSDRQLVAVAEGVEDLLKPEGRKPLSVEQSPDWVAMDFGDVVVHLFSPERRAATDLEGLWTDAPRVPTPGARA